MAILATNKNNSQKKNPPVLLLPRAPKRCFVILHSCSTQNQQRPYQKLSEKWLLITSLSGCSLEQKLPSSVTHSPDGTRPGTPFLTSVIPGLRSTLECRNLISSNSFAHRLGTGNFALRLAPGPVGLKPELRQGRNESIYKILTSLNPVPNAQMCVFDGTYYKMMLNDVGVHDIILYWFLFSLFLNL